MYCSKRRRWQTENRDFHPFISAIDLRGGMCHNVRLGTGCREWITDSVVMSVTLGPEKKRNSESSPQSLVCRGVPRCRARARTLDFCEGFGKFGWFGNAGQSPILLNFSALTGGTRVLPNCQQRVLPDYTSRQRWMAVLFPNETDYPFQPDRREPASYCPKTRRNFGRFVEAWTVSLLYNTILRTWKT